MINTLNIMGSQQIEDVTKNVSVAQQIQKEGIKVKQDTFEKSNTAEVIYETYSKDMVKEEYPLSPFGEYPLSPFGNRYGYEFQNEIDDNISMYYEGKFTENQVLEYFESCCQKMMEHYMPNGIQNEGDVQYAGQIVEEMYGEFKRFNTGLAVHQDWLAGKELNRQYRYSGDRDFAYYSARHYYQWKHMEEEILNKANEVKQNITGEKIDYRGPHTTTYNELWNNWFCTNGRLSGMKDISQEPPEDFEMFYKQKPYEGNADENMAGKGQFMIHTKAGKDIMDVPFNYNEFGLRGQIFGVKKLLERMGVSRQKEYYDFADNFLIFTRGYGTFYGVTDSVLQWYE